MASELSEFVVELERRSAIKSQVLADFIADWTSPGAQQETEIEPWVIYCDGAWDNEGVRISAIIESPLGGQNEIHSTAKVHQTRYEHQQHYRI